jgi:hypothetical protein
MTILPPYAFQGYERRRRRITVVATEVALMITAEVALMITAEIRGANRCAMEIATVVKDYETRTECGGKQRWQT